MNHSVEDICDDLRDAERSMDNLVQLRDDAQTRLDSIRDAAARLETDEAVSRSLERNLEHAKQQLSESQDQISQLLEKVTQYQEQLQENAESCVRNRGILQGLEEIGEDVAEGMGVIDQREQSLQEASRILENIFSTLSDAQSGEADNRDAQRLSSARQQLDMVDKLLKGEEVSDVQRDPTLPADQLAIVAEMERSGQMEVDPLDLGETVRTSERPLMSDLRITMPVRTDKTYTPAQIAAQIQMQEDGLNSMTVAEFVDHYENYRQNKRDLASNREQARYKEGLIQGEAYEIHQAKPELTSKQALAEARKYVGKGAALHNPDQKAGGDASEIHAYGNLAANSALGGLWASERAEDLYAQVMNRIAAGNMSRDVMENTMMDVRLEMKIVK